MGGERQEGHSAEGLLAMRVRPPFTWYFAAAVGLWIFGRWAFDAWQSPVAANQPLLTEGEYAVVRVVDGDTLILRQDEAAPQATVRLLGVDAPETVHPNKPVEKWGPEASAFTKQFVAEGKVSLRLDRRRADRYGRCLAYVYVGDSLLNAELLRAGLARVAVLTGDTLSLDRQLRQAAAEAKRAGRGRWSEAVEEPVEESERREAE